MPPEQWGKRKLPWPLGPNQKPKVGDVCPRSQPRIYYIRSDRKHAPAYIYIYMYIYIYYIYTCVPHMAKQMLSVETTVSSTTNTNRLTKQKRGNNLERSAFRRLTACPATPPATPAQQRPTTQSKSVSHASNNLQPNTKRHDSQAQRPPTAPCNWDAWWRVRKTRCFAAWALAARVVT